MTTDLQIITHCYAGPEGPPVYDKLLFAQLSSLCDSKLSLNIRVDVVCYENDAKTINVVHNFRPPTKLTNPNVVVKAHTTSKKQLFRRGVGRNLLCKDTDASVVWFTDCDYVFGPGALDAAVSQCLASEKNMVYPQHVLINKTHELGDRLNCEIASHLNDDEFPLSPVHIASGDFVRRKESNAWGGMFIVKGDYCRKHGYLDDTKWSRPVMADHFLQCRCDVPFRRLAGGAEAVDIPNVYRIRHSLCGRDRGTVDHGRKTKK